MTNCSHLTLPPIALTRTSKSSLEMKRRGSDSAKTIRGDFVTIKRVSASIRPSLKSRTFIRINLLRCSLRECTCPPQSLNLRNHTMIQRSPMAHRTKSSSRCQNHSLVLQKWIVNKTRLFLRVVSRATIVRVKLLKVPRPLVRWRIGSKTTENSRTKKMIPDISCHNREEWKLSNRSSVCQLRKETHPAPLKTILESLLALHLEAQSKHPL